MHKIFIDRELKIFPWNNNDELTEAISYCDQSFNKILDILVRRLNDTHGISREKIYWKRVVGRFLLAYIHTLYDKYSRAQRLIKNHGVVYGRRDELQALLSFTNSMDFISKVRHSDDVNQYLQCRVMNSMGLDMQCKYIEDHIVDNNSFKLSIKRIILSIFNRGERSEIALFVTLMNKRNLIELALRMKLRAFPILKQQSTENCVKNIRDEKLRTELTVTNNTLDEFQSIVLAMLKDDLPLEYVEGFSCFKAKADKKIAVSMPKIIITGIGFSWDTEFSVWAAECLHKGSKLFGVQHGGVYGESEPSCGEVFEKSIADKFISWGWLEQGVIPLPSPHLMGFTKKKYQWNVTHKDILLVTTLDSKYTYFLSLLPFSDRFNQYFDMQDIFYNQLNDREKKSLKVRLYQEDFGWGAKDKWIARDNNMRFDNNNVPLWESALKSKLVVIDYFGSTCFHECLVMNIPTIVYGDPELFRVRKSAQPYYDAMLDVGVFHYSPESAAEEINNISNNVMDWWDSPIRQEAVEKFKNNFSAVEGGVKIWVDFLEGELND